MAATSSKGTSVIFIGPQVRCDACWKPVYQISVSHAVSCSRGLLKPNSKDGKRINRKGLQKDFRL